MSEHSATRTAAKKTPLYDRHVALGAKIIDFGGWLMPVQYKTGILDEHKTVREAVGLFDVCHMGEVFVRGPRAAAAVQRVVTNNVAKLADGEAMYTCTCREDGGIVDDCIVYRRGAEDFLIIVNASTADKDFAHFVEHAGGLASWENVSEKWGLVAVQGPRAMELMRDVTDGALPPKPFSFVPARIGGVGAMVTRTGYTGEDGVEVLAPAGEIGAIWDLLLDQGAKYGAKPIGLGARDTLRLEAKLSLYGNDIDEEHTPLEAGLGWVVKGKGYVGEEALAAQKARGLERKLVGFTVDWSAGGGKPIARHGYDILDESGAKVGVVTSGTVAPTVGGAVGIGYVPTALASPGTRLQVDVRGKRAPIVVVDGPFYKRRK